MPMKTWLAFSTPKNVQMPKTTAHTAQRRGPGSTSFAPSPNCTAVISNVSRASPQIERHDRPPVAHVEARAGERRDGPGVALEQLDLRVQLQAFGRRRGEREMAVLVEHYQPPLGGDERGARQR